MLYIASFTNSWFLNFHLGTTLLDSEKNWWRSSRNWSPWSRACQPCQIPCLTQRIFFFYVLRRQLARRRCRQCSALAPGRTWLSHPGGMEEATSREIVGFILLALETYPKNAFPAKENLAFLRFFSNSKRFYKHFFRLWSIFTRNAP